MVCLQCWINWDEVSMRSTHSQSQHQSWQRVLRETRRAWPHLVRSCCYRQKRWVRWCCRMRGAGSSSSRWSSEPWGGAVLGTEPRHELQLGNRAVGTYTFSHLLHAHIGRIISDPRLPGYQRATGYHTVSAGASCSYLLCHSNTVSDDRGSHSVFHDAVARDPTQTPPCDWAFEHNINTDLALTVILHTRSTAVHWTSDRYCGLQDRSDQGREMIKSSEAPCPVTGKTRFHFCLRRQHRTRRPHQQRDRVRVLDCFYLVPDKITVSVAPHPSLVLLLLQSHVLLLFYYYYY